MSPVEIRAARPADKGAVAALSAHIWEGEDYVPDAFDNWLADGEGQFSVAVEGDELLGFAKLTRLGAGEWWLEGLRVHPEQRGRGIARRLHEHMVSLAEKVGAGVLRLATNANNRAVHYLAESTGFRRICGYMGARVESGSTGVAPAGLLPVAPREKAALASWLRASPYFAASHGLYEEHWTWLSLVPRLAQLLAAGLVYWWQPEAKAAGVVIFDPGTEEQAPASPLRLSYLAAPPPALPALTDALRSHAASLRRPVVTSRPLATAPLRAAYDNAGWEVKEYELWIFEYRLPAGAIEATPETES